MIIELFGPPGSGKTTLASQLAQQLCDRGHTVRIALSYRQGKVLPYDPLGIALSLFRVLAAIMSTCRIVVAPRSRASSLHLSAQLVRIIPPANWLWRLRLWRYILHLSDCWIGANAAEVVIFDQGFVQAVGTLATFHGSATLAQLREALRISPRADVSIRIVASEQAVRENLQSRTHSETPAERLFDASVATNMRSFAVFETLASELTALKTRRIDVNVDNIRNSALSETEFLEPLVAEIEEVLASRTQPAITEPGPAGTSGAMPTSPPAISQLGGI